MSRSASVFVDRYVSEERMKKGIGFQGLVIEFLEIISNWSRDFTMFALILEWKIFSSFSVRF